MPHEYGSTRRGTSGTDDAVIMQSAVQTTRRRGKTHRGHERKPRPEGLEPKDVTTLSGNDLRISEDRSAAESGSSGARTDAAEQDETTQTTNFQPELKIKACDATHQGVPTVTVTKTSADAIENRGFGDTTSDSGLSTVVEAWPRLTDVDRQAVVDAVRAFDRASGVK